MVILDYYDAGAALEGSSSPQASGQLVRSCIAQQASVPVPAATRECFHPLEFHQQGGPSKPRNFKAKLYQQIEGIFGRAYSRCRKIVWTYDAGVINANKDILLCVESALDVEISQWCLGNFPCEKDHWAHQQPSGLSWRRYPLFTRDSGLEERSDARGHLRYLCRCSPPAENAQVDEDESEWIESPSPYNIVSPSEVTRLIPGSTAFADSRSAWIDSILPPQPPRLRLPSPPVERRELPSQNPHPEITTPPVVVPQLNNVVHHPTQTVEAPSTTPISKPQAIVLVLSLIILLSLIMVVFCYVRGKVERRKDSSASPDILSAHSSPFSSAMGESGHRVKIEHAQHSPRFLSNAGSDLKSDRSPPAHGQFGILHSAQRSIASETLGNITPPPDMLQGSEVGMDKQQRKNLAVHTSLPSPLASRTASPTSVKHQTAEEPIPPHLDCTQSPSPQGNPTCLIECSPRGSGKTPSSLSALHHTVDFPSLDQTTMEGESCEIPTSSTFIRERSATTASYVRRRSYIVADKLSSILRPSVSVNFSGDYSSKPLPLRRLKTSFGVGDDFDSGEDQDHAALSRFFRRQYTEWSVEHLSGIDASVFETDKSSLSPAGFHSLKPRPRSSVFSLRSLETAGRLVSMKSLQLQGAICRPNSHYSCHLPSPHDATPNPISPASNVPLIHERDQVLANGAPHCPENGFFATHPYCNSRGPIASESLALDGQFCSSPKSLSSHSHSSKIPPPVDSTYEKAYGDSQELRPPVVPPTPAACCKKHRHSYSAPMTILLESFTDLEPVREIKLSVTNPDVELTEPETARKLFNPTASQAMSKFSRTCSNDLRDKDIHAPHPVPSLHVLCPADQGGHLTGNDEIDSEATPAENIEATESPSMTEAAVQKADDSETPCEFSKQSRRRTWLSSSLSLRILPRSSPSMKSAALNMSPARLRKSLSIGGRMSSGVTKAGHRPLDLEPSSPNPHDSQFARRTHVTAQDGSLSSKESSHPADSPLHHGFSKSSSSSLATLLGLFSSKPKRSSSSFTPEHLGIPPSPSPSSELMGSSESYSSHSEHAPCSFFEFSRAHSPQSIESNATIYSRHSPASCFDRAAHTYSSPYSSAPPSSDDHLDQANLAYGRTARDTAHVQWKSRLNSVGSFIDDAETFNKTSQPSLVIANPDMTHSNETASFT